MFDHSSNEFKLINQLYLALKAAKADQAEEEGLTHTMNGEIETDSESDNPEDYINLEHPLSEAGKKVIMKRRAAIWRHTQRLKAKTIAEN